ncbi:MAG: thiamine pyrophosphate-binding protein [Clostridia bacterium]|nr:thiamine pyrophosphate-binding protein [Clostridia bacterium]
MNGAEFIVRILIKSGSRTVFGYPGGTVLSLYDSLYRHRSEIRHVRTSHEQGSAHAADGFARMSGKPGVCIATSGPGATNLVTGIANAFMDSVPVIFITGNVEHSLIGTDSFQEVDIVGMTLGITKHSWAVRSPDMLIDAMTSAERICMTGRRGPVLVDVAKDVLDCDSPDYTDALEMFEPFSQTETACGAKTETAPDEEEISGVLGLIAESKKPLVICGGGVRQAGAGEELIEFARSAGAPVCQTLMGIGTLEPDEPLNLGLMGAMAGKAAKKALNECDLIIAVGARLGNKVADISGLVSGGKKLVQIDADRAEINKIVKADAYIASDAKMALRGILARSGGIAGRKPWLTRDSFAENVSGVQKHDLKKGFVDPEDIFAAVKKGAGNSLTVASDVGLHQLYTASHFPLGPADRFISSGGLGTMGFGIGASIGAKIAGPERTTVLFAGDGGFMMSMNELATVAAEKLPLIIIVMRNGELGMVREMQRKYCGRRYSQTKLGLKVNIPRLCSSFGIDGVRARTAVEIEQAVKDAVCENRAVVIEVRTVLRGAEND